MRIQPELGTLPNIVSCSIPISMTPCPSPQLKRGNRRRSIPETMLLCLPRLRMRLRSFPPISPFRLAPQMVHPRHPLSSTTTSPAKSPRRVLSPPSSRSSIAIFLPWRRRFWRILANHRMRAVSLSRVVHLSEPRTQKRRDGRKRPTITKSTSPYPFPICTDS